MIGIRYVYISLAGDDHENVNDNRSKLLVCLKWNHMYRIAIGTVTTSIVNKYLCAP